MTAPARFGPRPWSCAAHTAGPGQPLAIAEELRERCFQNEAGEPTLIRWRETWWAWSPQGVWSEVSDEIVEGLIQDVLRHATHPDDGGQMVQWNPTPRRVADVRRMLQQPCRVANTITPGGRLDGQLEPEGINVLGGRVVWSEQHDCWHLEPASPMRFNTSTLAVSWDHDAPVSELWLKFLRETYDAEGQALLQEWMGYILSGRTDRQKWLQVIGPPRSGKSLTFKVLDALYGGAGNATSLKALGSQFGLAPLVTAPYAIIDDARLEGTGAIERLLSITGHGVQYVDRKNREPLSMRLPTRLTMLSNSPVPIDDPTGALDARALWLRAPWTKQGREDWALEYALTSDAVLQGVLRWALDGLARLNQGGQFTVQASAQEDRALSMALGNQIGQYLDEECIKVPTEYGMRLADVHTAYMSWRLRSGLRVQSQKATEVELAEVGLRARRVGPTDARGPYMVMGLLPLANADTAA